MLMAWEDILTSVSNLILSWHHQVFPNHLNPKWPYSNSVLRKNQVKGLCLFNFFFNLANILAVCLLPLAMSFGCDRFPGVEVTRTLHGLRHLCEVSPLGGFKMKALLELRLSRSCLREGVPRRYG